MFSFPMAESPREGGMSIIFPFLSPKQESKRSSTRRKSSNSMKKISSFKRIVGGMLKRLDPTAATLKANRSRQSCPAKHSGRRSVDITYEEPRRCHLRESYDNTNPYIDNQNYTGFGVLQTEIDYLDLDLNRKHDISFGSTAVSPPKKKQEYSSNFEDIQQNFDNSDEISPFCVCVQFEAKKISVTVNDESLATLLQCFGMISRCSIEYSVFSPNTGLQCGWGVVRFVNANDAILAAKAMGKILIADVSYYCYILSSSASYSELQIEMAQDFLMQQSSDVLSEELEECPRWDSVDEEYPISLQI